MRVRLEIVGPLGPEWSDDAPPLTPLRGGGGEGSLVHGIYAALPHSGCSGGSILTLLAYPLVGVCRKCQLCLNTVMLVEVLLTRGLASSASSLSFLFSTLVNASWPSFTRCGLPVMCRMLTLTVVLTMVLSVGLILKLVDSSPEGIVLSAVFFTLLRRLLIFALFVHIPFKELWSVWTTSSLLFVLYALAHA